MTINHTLWRATVLGLPNYPCPSCRDGRLHLVEDTMKMQETVESKTDRNDPCWEPDWIRKRFSCLMQCNCGEAVAVCGDHQPKFVQIDQDGDTDLFDSFDPKYFNPAPLIFAIPEACPEKIAEALRRAFSLYWSDLGSSANALRVGAEEILNDFGIAKTFNDKHGDRRDLSLHKRIEKLPPKHKEAADLLMAIKWVGNDGSHARPDGLKHEHLLKAFALFELALDLLYIDQRALLKKEAADIIKRKGVLRKCKLAKHSKTKP